MASVTSSIPTTTGSGAAATVTVMSTQVVTVAQNSIVRYSDHYFGAFSDVSGTIFLASVLVATILGWNRMVAIPVIASFCGILSNGLGWYAFIASEIYSLHARVGALIVADVCWQIQDVVLSFYSFFMLEKILTGFQRRLFMGLFIFLFIAVTCLRFTNTAMHIMLLITPGDDAHAVEYWYNTNYDITRAYWGVLAGLEMVSAVFLLRVFYSATHNARLIGNGNTRNHTLFSHLAQSSEIRVATLASIGITRAICFGFVSDVRYDFDRVAYTFEHTFPVFLIIDLLVTKMTKLQGAADNVAHHGEGKEFSDGSQPPVSNNTVGSDNGRGALPTMQREFPMVIGRWSELEPSISLGKVETTITAENSVEKAV